MTEAQYLTVDFLTPGILAWAALALVVTGAALLVHGLLRRRKFFARPSMQQHWEDQLNIRIELGCAILGLLAPLILLPIAVQRHGVALANYQTNIERKYHATDVQLSAWGGTIGKVDLTMPDGTRFTEAEVSLSGLENAEPCIPNVDKQLGLDQPSGKDLSP